MRLLRSAAMGLVLALLGAGAYIGAARAGWLRPDEAAMRASYGLPASRYISLGAQALHVVDEGRGPVVVLVHGSFASLRMWDAWAAALKGHYRVIRFDRPGMGLSGPHPQGRYDGDAEADLIAALAKQMQLPPFVLVGTSSSGEGVAHFAATHPQALRAVVLANIAAGPLKPDSHFTLWMKAVLAFDGMLGGHHTQAFWGGILRMNFADPAAMPHGLAKQWTELNNRAQGWPRARRAQPFGTGTPGDLAAIRMPALALWSDRDPEVPLARDGRQVLQRLGSADKTLAVVERCGHMLAIECGARSLEPVQPFLARVTGQ